MGLNSQLNDVASDSLPFLLLSIIATFVTYVRSRIVSPSANIDDDINTISNYYGVGDDEDDDQAEEIQKDKCVFCFNGLKETDNTRKLTCHHVFHTDCLNGWIGLMKSSCPICRSPLLVFDWRVGALHRSVCYHVSSWFAVR